MQSFLSFLTQTVSDLAGSKSQDILFQSLPRLVGSGLSKYFRLEIEGLENIPPLGRGLIAPNHSGYSGFDAFVLKHQIQETTKRSPKILTHHLWFSSEWTGTAMKKMGFVEATRDKGQKILENDDLLILFPEGEAGNFKPTVKRYHMQKFRGGLIRLAIRCQTPVIPTLILGAEESHINLARINVDRWIPGQSFPLPLNLIPLPVRWKIIFLKPRVYPFEPEEANNQSLIRELSEELREEMQSQLSIEAQNKNWI